MLHRFMVIILLMVSLSFSYSSRGEVLEKSSEGEYRFLKEKVNLNELLVEYTGLIGADLTILSKKISSISVNVVGNKVIKKDNMDEFISKILSYENQALVISKDRKEYSVLNGREARFKALPLYSEGEELPNSNNFIKTVYKVKSVDLKALARNVRPFRSRYGYVMANSDANMITISDAANHAKEILSIMKMMDTPEIAKDVENVREINERFKKLSAEKEDFLTVLNQNNIMFIVIFSLIFLIIGFLTRGYVIRHLEGGL